jgi:hypothetical protein
MQLTLRSVRLAATVLAFTALAACSKKEDATPTPTPAAAEGMSWTVDGSSVTATAVAQTTGTDVTLAGSTGSTGGIFLDMPKTVGTYPLSSSSTASASYVVTPTQGGSQFYDATSGSIVVSTVTATAITGTFTFTGALSDGTKTKTLTNGKFNVKL